MAILMQECKTVIKGIVRDSFTLQVF